VVFGEYPMHLGDLFTAFCNQVLYSGRYRQPPLGFRVSPPLRINDPCESAAFRRMPAFFSQQLARDPATSRGHHRAPLALLRLNQVLAACL
jgi:hypothetical protein